MNLKELNLMTRNTNVIAGDDGDFPNDDTSPNVSHVSRLMAMTCLAIFGPAES
jgi:hypothetical protein